MYRTEAILEQTKNQLTVYDTILASLLSVENGVFYLITFLLYRIICSFLYEARNKLSAY